METKMFTAGGAAHITQKIREAVENGTREVTVRGAVKNLVLEGITAGEGTPPILDERTV